mmetsp:Transcript_26678/g.73578  ORF Transcript_26678/g.73578 Transcript_26678/m.73578 type:complete len:200 (+) Transcript_26678:283-882(+)
MRKWHMLADAARVKALRGGRIYWPRIIVLPCFVHNVVGSTLVITQAIKLHTASAGLDHIVEFPAPCVGPSGPSRRWIPLPWSHWGQLGREIRTTIPREGWANDRKCDCQRVCHPGPIKSQWPPVARTTTRRNFHQLALPSPWPWRPVPLVRQRCVWKNQSRAGAATCFGRCCRFPTPEQYYRAANPAPSCSYHPVGEGE